MSQSDPRVPLVNLVSSPAVPDLAKAASLFCRTAVACLGIALILTGLFLALSVFKLVERMVVDPQMVAGQLERWVRAIRVDREDAAKPDESKAQEAPGSVPPAPSENEPAPLSPESTGEPKPNDALAQPKSAPPETSASEPHRTDDQSSRATPGFRDGRRPAPRTRDDLDGNKLLMFLWDGLVEGRFGPALSAILLLGFTFLLARIPLSLITCGSKILLAVVK